MKLKKMGKKGAVFALATPVLVLLILVLAPIILFGFASVFAMIKLMFFTDFGGVGIPIWVILLIAALYFIRRSKRRRTF